jgi:hypothetical protein
MRFHPQFRVHALSTLLVSLVCAVGLAGCSAQEQAPASETQQQAPGPGTVVEIKAGFRLYSQACVFLNKTTSRARTQINSGNTTGCKVNGHKLNWVELFNGYVHPSAIIYGGGSGG